MNLFVAGVTDAPAGTARAALERVLRELPFFPVEDVRVWAKGRAQAAWVAHRPERVGGVEYARVEPERLVLWSGRPVRLKDEEEADGDERDGRFVCVEVRPEELVPETDQLGAYPLFAAGDWVSNAPAVLHELAPSGADEVALAGLLGGGWSLGGHPVWSGVRRVRTTVDDAAIARLPGAGLEPARAARRLTALVRALADWPGRPQVVPVTGGRDSRLVLAAALAAGLDGFATPTGGAPDDPDVVAAAELCARAGLTHERLGADPHGDRFSDLAKAARIVHTLSGGTATLADASGFPLGPREGPLPLWHSGQGGEIGRAYYGTATGDPVAHLERRFLARRPGRAPLLNAEGTQAVRAGIADFVAGQLGAGAHPRDMPDLFYLHERMGSWAAATHACVEPIRDTTSPLWSVPLLQDLLGAPRAGRAREQFHREVLQILRPDLVDVPFAGPGWPPSPLAARARRARTLARKALAESKRRVAARRPPSAASGRAQPHPFTPVLTTTRDAVLSDGSHPAWAVLDRAAVERLLTDPPAALDEMGHSYVWRLATVFLGEARNSRSAAST